MYMEGGAEGDRVWVYPPGPRTAGETSFWYLCELFFFLLALFFFFWLSCSSLLIYCICSRGLGKGGSQTVSLPKGKEAGRHSYFSPQVMYVKVSQWENGRYKRAESWWRYLLSENRRKKHVTLELHPDKLEVSEVCFLSVVRTFPLILYILW